MDLKELLELCTSAPDHSDAHLLAGFLSVPLGMHAEERVFGLAEAIKAWARAYATHLASLDKRAGG